MCEIKYTFCLLKFYLIKTITGELYNPQDIHIY